MTKLQKFLGLILSLPLTLPTLVIGKSIDILNIVYYFMRDKVLARYRSMLLVVLFIKEDHDD